MQVTLRRLVLVLSGATVVMFLIPFLGFARWKVLGPAPLPISTEMLVDWIFPTVTLLIVGTVLGCADARAGWVLGVLAAAPAAVTNAQVSGWGALEVGRVLVWLVLGGLAGLLGSSMWKRLRNSAGTTIPATDDATPHA